MSAASIFTQAAVVAFREGLEATLMLGAVAGFMTKSGQGGRLYQLALGVVLGLVVAVVVAILVDQTFGLGPGKLIEAALLLGGAALMLYVSGWIWIGHKGALWQNLVLHLAKTAQGREANVALLLLALLITAREGAEVAIFSLAMMHGPEGLDAYVFGGLAAGAVALVFAYALIRALSIRLPVRVLFFATSACLFVMGLVFLGEGIGALQEAHYLSATTISDAVWLAGWGVNATWEAIMAQIMTTALALTGLIALSWSPT